VPYLLVIGAAAGKFSELRRIGDVFWLTLTRYPAQNRAATLRNKRIIHMKGT
jgi:hypothetical protein